MPGSWGGARPGAGKPKGSGVNPVRQMLRDGREAARDARQRLIDQIAGTTGDPLFQLVRVSMDEAQPMLLRVTAMRSVLPYIHSAAPLEQTHTHLHAKVDSEALMASLLQRLERLAPAPVIDAQPAEVEPALPAPEPAAG